MTVQVSRYRKQRAGLMLYNYAEFYPLARLKGDSSGECSLVTGLGSLLVWADNGSSYGFTLASPADTVVEVTIELQIRL
ncbi:MAG: hypothetical protein U5L72_11230 [Bacteroidales bacterium]|nr:hypothetical protein [Bacteroidales bacterium]